MIMCMCITALLYVTTQHVGAGIGFSRPLVVPAEQ